MGNGRAIVKVILRGFTPANPTTAQSKTSIAITIYSISILLCSLGLSSVLFHLKVFSSLSDNKWLRDLSIKFHTLRQTNAVRPEESTFGARGSAPYPFEKESEVDGKDKWYSSRIRQAVSASNGVSSYLHLSHLPNLCQLGSPQDRRQTKT